ncbi:MAG: M14 family metallopeptidase [Bacteroidota bacterium]
MKYTLSFWLMLLFVGVALSQDYYFKDKGPFNPDIPTPESFLGYEIGEYHTRHDLMVLYLQRLAELSDRVQVEVYGFSHERRPLIMLTISSPKNLDQLSQIKESHLRFVDPDQEPTNYDEVPIFVQLGYNVHGNEPSGGEAALLTAYTLVASEGEEVQKYLENAVIFIDPVLNPDGRDRFTQWVNQYRASPLVADKYDAEHNEMWPRGRTNHYWFDLNRDWLLLVHPESQGKINWYHQWYPNVVTDVHEMGTNSSYFFEPMKPIGSKDPIMPRENYEDLNDLFATYFANDLDSLGSFYFTKEAFDGTYPGYGSSYPDLQGGLALLFEQASSRGHLQETDYEDITFPFTIRNQYTSSFATIRASVENKATLRKYQQAFFRSAVDALPANGFKAYEFGDDHDMNRNKAFIEMLLMHKIKVYRKGDRFVVPVAQPQRRMVQTVFETYREYRDSVFYDASAWSVANCYNMQYQGVRSFDGEDEITNVKDLVKVEKVQPASYAYILDWNDYYAPAATYHMQAKGLKVASAFKGFKAKTQDGEQSFSPGAIMIPVSRQSESAKEVFRIVAEAQKKFNVPVYAVNGGFSLEGIDLGSRYFEALEKPKALLLIGDGVSSYEAGEVWHLLDTRVKMPITKVQMRMFPRVELERYNTLVMVSGSYRLLDSTQRARIVNWVKQGHTLITSAGASTWAIQNKIVREKITVDKTKKKPAVKPLPYISASEHLGREQVGGAIFEVKLDLTHPLAFGYQNERLPVYKNNEVFLQPSTSPYATVAKYTKEPHIDGYISKRNYETFLKPSASVIVSPLGGGRVVMFADNPNFRGVWYGTNRLFLNALFLGKHIRVPR